jgi:hypothetical protein
MPGTGVPQSRLRQAAIWSGVGVTAAVVGIALLEFPYDVDAPVSAQELEKSRMYYAEAYRQSNPTEPQSPSA